MRMRKFNMKAITQIIKNNQKLAVFALAIVIILVVQSV